MPSREERAFAATPAGGPAGYTSLNTPWVESPFFAQELARRRSELTDAEQELARQLHDQGYAVLEQAVPHELCDRAREQVDPLFVEGFRTTARRVPDAWLEGADAVRELATLPSVQQVLQTLYGRRPIPFQTLTFKWGTQQADHTDQMHFSCLPARFMCGVWVAFEDTDEDNGPLFYYPGSHKLPELTGYDLGFTVDDYFYPAYERVLEQLMTELGYKPVEFHARKGDALIWASNLVHGGRPVRREGSTRWSQVSHYMFEGCIYYQPHSSEMPTGEYRMLDIIDLNTLDPVPSSYNGRPIGVVPMGNARARLWDGDPPPGLGDGVAPAPVAAEPAEPVEVQPAPAEPAEPEPEPSPEPISPPEQTSFGRDLVRLVARHLDRHPFGHRVVQAALKRRG